MHAVVVNVTINDPDTATHNLQDTVVPQISAAPGFVGGYWVRLETGKGSSIAVFESEQVARDVAARVTRPDDSVTIDTVEVGEVVASA